MTQEDKELLLKDLCARLPYVVKGKITADCIIPHRYDNEGFPLEGTFDVNVELNGINIDTEEISINVFENKGDLSDYIDECQSDSPWTIKEFKPYLRPMSSMTEDERNEYFSVKMRETERVALAEIYRPEAVSEIMDWLNAHYFDYRGLIEKGLALEAPEGMYK